MDHKTPRNKDHLTFRTDFFADPSSAAGYAALMRGVFELDAEARAAAVGQTPAWMPFGYFDREAGCAASVEAAAMTMMADSAKLPVTAIRLAAVDPDWRGLGLFRDLMLAALAWCEAAAPGPTLLYTADHALYTRFGFHPVSQFKMSGPAPTSIERRPFRALDPRAPADGALIRRLLATRAPVSTRCALMDAASLFLTNVMDAEDLRLVHVPSLDAIIAYEVDEASLLLVDVVAATIPTMAQILSALPPRPRVTTLFPTDRLDWTGEPVSEDTGLMIRGLLPEAMRTPIMLPPTTEF